MKRKVTELVFLLDRSGSMAGLEGDTIGGFNAFLQKQCKEEGETVVTTVLFDDDYEVLWNGTDAKEVKLTEREYFVRGTTALLDAVGKSIMQVGQRIALTNNEERPEKVIFVITTDGMENASKEFTYPKIKELINHQQEKNNWEFIFMGANIDATEEAGNIGIKVENAYRFEASSQGVESMYDIACEMVLEKRRK
ncbi:vWA domain-containing protein [Bacillus alkalicellulosilyticus]|uniref:vWA domain-containing protein n=1 Tax=Alkalihalobacterium alkalicellulosilyticum TaxID=1912214 RepID=UPI000996AA16|nr:vWA domain-containing protein [Bacillus alkalicellulosilyticus]